MLSLILRSLLLFLCLSPAASAQWSYPVPGVPDHFLNFESEPVGLPDGLLYDSGYRMEVRVKSFPLQSVDEQLALLKRIAAAQKIKPRWEQRGDQHGFSSLTQRGSSIDFVRYHFRTVQGKSYLFMFLLSGAVTKDWAMMRTEAYSNPPAEPRPVTRKQGSAYRWPELR